MLFLSIALAKFTFGKDCALCVLLLLFAVYVILPGFPFDKDCSMCMILNIFPVLMTLYIFVGLPLHLCLYFLLRHVAATFLPHICM